MKKRMGFVSNSSSSSFVIAHKPGDYKALVEKKLLDGCSSDIAKEIMADLAESFIRNVTEQYTKEDLMSLPEKLNEIYDLSDEQRVLLMEKVVEGFVLEIGSISDESEYDKIDNYLAHKEVIIEHDDLIIWKEAGY